MALANGFASLTVDKNTAVLLTADNMDHEVFTLDGKNIFNGMSKIAAVTPEDQDPVFYS